MDTMYATDRQTSDRHDCLMPPTLMAGHNNASSKTSYHWYQKCVSPCGETTFSPQGHLLRIRNPIRKKHRYYICVCPCGETTYFPHKTILSHEYATKVERKFLYGVVSIVRDLGIYLHSSLTMNAHISRTVPSCFAALSQVRSVRRPLPLRVMSSL